jgi:sporulation protein YlmC with PRC-barrel domain
MRLSELLGREVTDRTGVRIGTVIDVRLAQDGPPRAQGQAALRITGLIVSPRSSGRLLGYERTPKEGPWLVRMLVLGFNRGVRYVPWEWVDRIDTTPLRVDRAASEIPHLRDLPTPPGRP